MQIFTEDEQKIKCKSQHSNREKHQTTRQQEIKKQWI
jgi:hypothetical protein